MNWNIIRIQAVSQPNMWITISYVITLIEFIVVKPPSFLAWPVILKRPQTNCNNYKLAMCSSHCVFDKGALRTKVDY